MDTKLLHVDDRKGTALSKSVKMVLKQKLMSDKNKVIRNYCVIGSHESQRKGF